MKRIYLAVTLLLAFAGSAFAQKDLQLLSNMTNPDTFKYNSSANGGAKTFYIFIWGFKNTSTTPFTTTDTLFMKSPLYNGNLKLTLPTAGIPAGDTVYFRDTVGFNGPSNPNPAQWCDSVWFTSAGAPVADPTPNDNKKCSSVLFIQDPLSVDDAVANKNELFVYPNPATSVLKVKHNFNGTESSVVIRDLIGKVVYQQNFGKVNGMKEFAIDINHLAGGMYMVELNTADTKVINKITVQK